MNCSPFSGPIFLGHSEARGRCSQGERLLYGRDLCRSGGTGKAEAEKLPGAGIGPKQCPGKCVPEKGKARDSVNRREGAWVREQRKAENCKAVECVLKDATRRSEST